MKAKCISLRYQQGDFGISQGIKGGGQPGRSYYKKGRRCVQQGNGWQTEYTPSKLILTIETKTGYAEVWVDRFFKDTVGRLTKKRREKLKRSMPETIRVHRDEGSSYFYADERDLDAWRDAAGL